MISHVILEVSCHLSTQKDVESAPKYCRYGVQHTGYHCLYNRCPYSAFTDAPHEIAYANENGEINIYENSEWIGFGGDMEPENLSEEETEQYKKIWKEICVRKIGEAYDEYMKEVFLKR